jgi:hypothetical protein
LRRAHARKRAACFTFPPAPPIRVTQQQAA